jgi:DegV family protein with EDD domain
MQKIAIITDTDSSLPKDLAEKMGIHQVPITIHFGSESFTSGLDIDDQSVFVKIDQLKKLPTTSAPAPGVFAEAYQAAFSAGADAVICICVSSKVSATYGSAVTARDMFPQRDITVVDSLNLTMGQGFMALAAAEAARAGAGKDEILALIAETGSQVHCYAMLPTLKYLAMSGRVGKLAAGMADTLNIKPILTIKDGKLDLLERVRTRNKAIERMLALTQAAVNGKKIARAAVIHVGNPQGAEEVRQQLCAMIACPESTLVTEIGPGMSVHTGAGVVGVVVQTA